MDKCYPLVNKFSTADKTRGIFDIAVTNAIYDVDDANY